MNLYPDSPSGNEEAVLDASIEIVTKVLYDDFNKSLKYNKLGGAVYALVYIRNFFDVYVFCSTDYRTPRIIFH